MAKNVVREAGAPVHGTVLNGAAAKLSGQLVPWPITQAALSPVALLLKDAAISEDNVPAMLGGVTVRYAALTTDVAPRGTVCYFDHTNDRIVATAGTLNRAGRYATPKANGEVLCDFILNCP